MRLLSIYYFLSNIINPFNMMTSGILINTNQSYCPFVFNSLDKKCLVIKKRLNDDNSFVIYDNVPYVIKIDSNQLKIIGTNSIVATGFRGGFYFNHMDISLHKEIKKNYISLSGLCFLPQDIRIFENNQGIAFGLPIIFNSNSTRYFEAYVPIKQCENIKCTIENGIININKHDQSKSAFLVIKNQKFTL